MMADSTIAIIVAAVALAGTIITAGFSAWFAYWSDKHKRQRELRVFFAKYQDAILLASQDLQSRLYNIVDYKITEFYSCDGRFKDNLLIYTAFVVGQYLSWVYIIRQRAQFLQYETGQTNKQITTAIDAVSDEWLSDLYGECFMLWRGDQMAIGEMMTVRDGDQLSPMGYGTFFTKWGECEPYTGSSRGREKVRSSSEKSIYRGVESVDAVDPQPPVVYERRNHAGNIPHGIAPSLRSSGKSSEFEPAGEKGSQGKSDGQKTRFREWFEPITAGIIHIAEEKAKAKPNRKGTNTSNCASEDAIQVAGDFRLRNLQHRLVDLIDILDSRGERSEARRTRRARPSHSCECSVCKCCSPEAAEHQYRIWNWNLHIRKNKSSAHA